MQVLKLLVVLLMTGQQTIPGTMTASDANELHPPKSATVNVVVPAPNPVATKEGVFPV
jgi:hypothetical protein